MLLTRRATSIALLGALHCGPSDHRETTDTDAATTSDAATSTDAVTTSDTPALPDVVVPDEGADATDPNGLVVFPGQFTGENMPLRMLGDGDAVDLMRPLQGGHVVFIGPKVQNLTTDAIDLRVRFRRTTTGAILQEERRTVIMVPAEPGFMQPDLRSQSQVGQPALCPDYEKEDVLGQELILEVEVLPLFVDHAVPAIGRRRVVPTCDRSADQALCKCECTANYVLGRCRG